MWPWSTIRALRGEVSELRKALRIEHNLGVTAENQLREYRVRLKDFQSSQERASFSSDGSILPGSPLAEKVSKLQKRAYIYNAAPLPVRPIAPKSQGEYVRESASLEERRQSRNAGSDGMDSMYAAAVFGLVTAKAEEKNECRNETAAPEFKSGGGGDFGGGGATGSWDSSSSSSSDSSSSDSGSSSSD